MASSSAPMPCFTVIPSEVYDETTTKLWKKVSRVDAKRQTWLMVFRTKPVDQWSENAMKTFASFAMTELEAGAAHFTATAAAEAAREAAALDSLDSESESDARPVTKKQKAPIDSDSESDARPVTKKPKAPIDSDSDSDAEEAKPLSKKPKAAPKPKAPPKPKKEKKKKHLTLPEAPKRVVKKRKEAPKDEGIEVHAGDIVTGLDSHKNSVTGVVDRVMINPMIGNTAFVRVKDQTGLVMINFNNITFREAIKKKSKKPKAKPPEKKLPIIGSTVTFHHVGEGSKLFTGIVTERESFHIRVFCKELQMAITMHKNSVVDCFDPRPPPKKESEVSEEDLFGEE
jgi:hypothetical protein